jgi:hypothetical protein
MSGWTSERWAASSGVLFAVLFVVGNGMTGDPPDYNASAGEVAAFLTDKHAELTVQTIVGGALIVIFLWFLASFAGYFRQAGERRLATVMYGAGVAGIAIAAIGDAVTIAVTQLLPVLDEGSVQALWGVTFFIYLRLFWPLCALALATGIATWRSRAMPQWYAGLSLLAAVVFFLGGISIRMNGFFSPEGAPLWMAFIGFGVWVLVSSILLVARVGRNAPSEAAVTPA